MNISNFLCLNECETFVIFTVQKGKDDIQYSITKFVIVLLHPPPPLLSAKRKQSRSDIGWLTKFKKKISKMTIGFVKLVIRHSRVKSSF